MNDITDEQKKAPESLDANEYKEASNSFSEKLIVEHLKVST